VPALMLVGAISPLNHATVPASLEGLSRVQG
jgi:hypothetical protein